MSKTRVEIYVFSDGKFGRVLAISSSIDDAELIVNALNSHASLKECYDITRNDLSKMTEACAALQADNAELREALHEARYLLIDRGITYEKIDKVLSRAEGK